jgi:hypothetical protein
MIGALMMISDLGSACRHDCGDSAGFEVFGGVIELNETVAAASSATKEVSAAVLQQCISLLQVQRNRIGDCVCCAPYLSS